MLMMKKNFIVCLLNYGILVTCRSLPVVDPGLFVISGVTTCGSGSGYCLLGMDCTLNEDFLADDGSGHCEGLKNAFTPTAYFVCCKYNNRSGIDKPVITLPVIWSSVPNITTDLPDEINFTMELSDPKDNQKTPSEKSDITNSRDGENRSDSIESIENIVDNMRMNYENLQSIAAGNAQSNSTTKIDKDESIENRLFLGIDDNDDKDDIKKLFEKELSKELERTETYDDEDLGRGEVEIVNDMITTSETAKIWEPIITKRIENIGNTEAEKMVAGQTTPEYSTKTTDQEESTINLEPLELERNRIGAQVQKVVDMLKSSGTEVRAEMETVDLLTTTESNGIVDSEVVTKMGSVDQKTVKDEMEIVDLLTTTELVKIAESTVIINKSENKFGEETTTESIVGGGDLSIVGDSSNIYIQGIEKHKIFGKNDESASFSIIYPPGLRGDYLHTSQNVIINPNLDRRNEEFLLQKNQNNNVQVKFSNKFPNQKFSIPNEPISLYNRVGFINDKNYLKKDELNANRGDGQNKFHSPQLTNFRNSPIKSHCSNLMNDKNNFGRDDWRKINQEINCQNKWIFSLDGGKTVCYAVLLNPIWLLTTASCITRLFEHGMDQIHASSVNYPKPYRISNMIVHENYKLLDEESIMETNNIGLVSLMNSADVSCVPCIPHQNENFDGQICASYQKQNVTKYSPGSGCQGKARSLGSYPDMYLALPCKATIRIQPIAENAGIFQDSLWCGDILAGIENNNSRIGSLTYTPVSSYVDWIIRNIELYSRK